MLPQRAYTPPADAPTRSNVVAGVKKKGWRTLEVSLIFCSWRMTQGHMVRTEHEQT